jgi:hypothetical protein
VEEILDSDPGALDRSLGEASGLKGEGSWSTPLVWAVAENKPELVRMLLARGAKVIAAPNGKALLDRAIENGHDEIAALLRGDPPTP